MLHTMQPMAFHDRDIPGESLFERGIIGIGDRLGLLAGVVLAVSAFTGWYSGPGEGVKVSVMGWDTGVAGKVVFFLGIAVVIVIALREVGVQMPATVPESLLDDRSRRRRHDHRPHSHDLEAGRLLLRRPRRRDLDQPHRSDRRDRRRAAAGLRRALTAGSSRARSSSPAAAAPARASARRSRVDGAGGPSFSASPSAIPSTKIASTSAGDDRAPRPGAAARRTAAGAGLAHGV